MSKKATSRTKRSLADLRWIWTAGVTILTAVVLLPTLGYAHGMEGQEIGPPILTSGILGFLCYWLVMLWPSAKKRGNAATQSGKPPQSLAGHARLSRGRAQPSPRLRKIERRGRAVSPHH
ncbi:MAG: hypothetical protein NZ578_16905 [Candidatus Binatia bacterium]|nr:hypothetical protein [Candidatus Binatia bacterium]